jgi:hypothetical protein
MTPADPDEQAVGSDASAREQSDPPGGGDSAVPEAMSGDWIEVDATQGGFARRGLILETLGTGVHRHFRVRWDEEHESLFYPAERGFIVHRKAGQRDAPGQAGS